MSAQQLVEELRRGYAAKRRRRELRVIETALLDYEPCQRRGCEIKDRCARSTLQFDGQQPRAQYDLLRKPCGYFMPKD
ncbi:MAG: hypothetical protein RL341_2140 [Pseudomonadota bacterium]|jgi:hypothetical protein